jgi:steroid delta-isomerase-like uncharacterized protein
MKKHSYILIFLAMIPFFFTQCTTLKDLKSEKKNEETVRLWFEEGWNHNRNDELLTRCFHEDWSDGNPLRANQTGGIEGMRELIKSYRKAFPDGHFTITHLFADGNQVAIRYEVTATHHAEMFGIPATGKQFTSTGIVIYEMKDGKILTSWQELDLMGIMNQLQN